LAAARKLDDPWCLVEALTYTVGARGREDPAGVSAGEEALALARQIGAPSRVAIAAVLLASAVAISDLARANQLLEEAGAAAALALNDWVDYVTSMALISLHLAVDDLRAAADGALAAIDWSVAQRLPGHLLQFVGTLAGVLATMNDSEGSLVLAAWAERRGSRVHQADTAFLQMYGGETIVAMYAQTPTAELERLSRVAADLDDRGIVQFARERVANLPAETR
jgi:hypothetical protein